MPVDPFWPTGNDAAPRKVKVSAVSFTIVSTPNAPAAIGPYSQAVKASQLLFLSGQIPLVPATMELVGPGIEEQTRQVLENLKAILEAERSALSAVTKTTIFLTDLADFTVVNRIYGEYFAAPFPARATVAVAALPRGARIEIEAIAVLE